MPTQNRYEGSDIESAYKLALEQISGVEDIERLCLKSGAKYLVSNSQQEIIVPYLNRSYRIIMPGVEILLADSEEEITLKDKVLILHYLLLSKGTPLSNKLISFKQLLGGASYFMTFSSRVIEPLVEHFGENPQVLTDVAGKFGAHTVELGDVAVCIDAFSHVPVTIVLWRGDEEFPANGNVLFDASIQDYLTTYDVTVLCEGIVWKLVKLSNEGRVLSRQEGQQL